MKIRKSSHGFTLIELLVVIVIIAILAGISLPVFSRIMERGKVIQELSNLRQIGIASLAYMNDNDGYVAADFVTQWATILGGDGTTEGRYVQDSSVFLSPFDARTPNASDPALPIVPISFGPNSNIAGTPNTELWKSTSTLVFIGPTLTALEVFEGQRAASGEISQAVEFGSHSEGRRTSILFADFHVEAVNLPELKATGPTAKFKWAIP